MKQLGVKRLEPLGWALVGWGLLAGAIAACGPVVLPPEGEGADDTDTETAAGTTTASASTTTEAQDDDFGDMGLDLFPTDPTDDVPDCALDGTCNLVDVLLVIDNSGTMGEEQRLIAQSLPQLVDELQNLTDADGAPIGPNVNLMVTTTDVGHPLCTVFQKPDYAPRLGAPVYTGCNSRIQRFTGLDPADPLEIEEACTEGCPVDVAPTGHFIHFDPLGSNVPGDDVGAALACIGPQGIDGCGYESPLEAMLLAIDESACWNQPDQAPCDTDAEWAEAEQGFLREDAVLAVVIVTDELDCSVNAPEGHSYFTDVDNTVYWSVNPQGGVPQASSAICFNAGVSCTDTDADGIYESCTARENEALHPIERYVSYLDYLTEQQGKEVVMLGIVGVPEVVDHEPELPYTPTAGGVLDVVYRQWIDLPYPAGDILPAEWEADPPVRAADKAFEFGALAPGCTGIDAEGGIIGQALPPVRLRQVCESLDGIDEETGEPRVRCALESLCDTDHGPAFRGLAGMIAQVLGDHG